MAAHVESYQKAAAKIKFQKPWTGSFIVIIRLKRNDFKRNFLWTTEMLRRVTRRPFADLCVNAEHQSVTKITI